LLPVKHGCADSTENATVPKYGAWLAATVPLVIASILLTALAPFVGLLLGGSLSHAVESSLRGGITDYLCLRFWPAFNLADLALVVGAVGTIGELLMLIRTIAF